MFSLAIETNNAAFEDNSVPEIARILRALAAKLEAMGAPAVGPYRLLDMNGNKVGMASFSE